MAGTVYLSSQNFIIISSNNGAAYYKNKAVLKTFLIYIVEETGLWSPYYEAL
jgi:hypothetical protein